MSIIGIDYNKCNSCGFCILECPRRFSRKEAEDKVIFDDPTGSCIHCGHCIAVCPQEAICFSEGLGEEPYIFQGFNDLSKYIPYEKLYNFLRAHRSIRRYKKELVPKETINKVIEAMEYAPTGANLRAERFAVLSNRDKLKSLSDAVKEELLKNSATRSMYEESFQLRSKMYEYQIYFDAPHVIFVYSLGNTPIDHYNIANTVTYGRLAAQALGLGTCYNGWTQIAFQNNTKLTKIAGIRGKSWGVFTLGYPNIKFYRCPPRPRRKVKFIE
jgi:nitroreductase/NAD-dependent dihydropyrimidine dehydrogenase PreA subunit